MESVAVIVGQHSGPWVLSAPRDGAEAQLEAELVRGTHAARHTRHMPFSYGMHTACRGCLQLDGTNMRDW